MVRAGRAKHAGSFAAAALPAVFCSLNRIVIVRDVRNAGHAMNCYGTREGDGHDASYHVDRSAVKPVSKRPKPAPAIVSVG
jgi:hypothetical protein